MRTITAEELRKIMLDILKDVASFCDANGITYFLSCGTLIGAVRHHGFIPWDDDIDIDMPRPDYERFIKLYSEKGRCEDWRAPNISQETLLERFSCLLSKHLYLHIKKHQQLMESHHL